MIEHKGILEINGDIVKIKAKGIRYGELALLRNPSGTVSSAQVIRLQGDLVSLQVFSGGQGISTGATVRFLGHPMQVIFSDNILGRVFNGAGQPIDGGPDLSMDQQVEIAGPSINPWMRLLASRLIRTNIPMIDVFNCLVESQKIPIFTVAGEPFNELLARIGIQADADIIVFAGMGLTFDDYYYFSNTFQSQGVFSRTVMFVNLAADAVVERILTPDIALAVAERFAVEDSKRVLVLMTDMTAYADGLKEIGIAMDQIPSNRGYMGDLYSTLAFRYERACDFKGAGSVTILTVTTMPGDDVTHPVPDNTGFITEGQFYLHDRIIDPFGSLSRLKQLVIGKKTREDHGAVANTMIRLYAGAKEAQKKQSLAFELSEADQKLLRFGQLFKERFMDFNVNIALEAALELGWKTMAECFEPDELLMKEDLINKYFPHPLPVQEEDVVSQIRDTADPDWVESTPVATVV
ncbi:V-type ATP synthase subunit B [Neosynechococcus sphagnicola]|uniref:V-type ATP synthase subunit B n=1 Tax=Neosynechococcus sphagnicola TaxID=1501145 RepID=UPI00055FE32A|nr:V-type ATP synthase subunit B [Neosynechococcus sphagnicola]